MEELLQELMQMREAALTGWREGLVKQHPPTVMAYINGEVDTLGKVIEMLQAKQVGIPRDSAPPEGEA